MLCNELQLPLGIKFGSLGACVLHITFSKFCTCNTIKNERHELIGHCQLISLCGYCAQCLARSLQDFRPGAAAEPGLKLARWERTAAGVSHRDSCCGRV